MLDFFDNGYHKPSRVKSPRTIICYDGAGDDEGRVLSANTLPRLNPCSSTSRQRASLQTFESGSTLRSTGSLKSPDRFLPKRPSLASSTESFRSNKDPKTLSTTEKLVRNKEASPDAFNPRRRVTSPVPQAMRSPPQRRNFSGNRSGSGGLY